MFVDRFRARSLRHGFLRAIGCALVTLVSRHALARQAAPSSAASTPASSAAAASNTPPPTFSQDIVVTATDTPAPAADVSSTVNVLTRADLETMGISSIIDGLRLVPGVDPLARGPRDVQTDFSIRGATFGQSLMLVDGIRLNDSQTGHHDGEIPLAVAGIDRIEVVSGAGSAVHGADALGGTINVISRTGAYTDGSVEVGQFGYAAAQASTSSGLPAGWTITGWGGRSGGFEPDREFADGGGALRASLAPGWTIGISHQQRAFGANDFYGPAPSKEWTDQTLVSADWHETRGAWVAAARGYVRDHGDHYVYDITDPSLSDNRHRTNEAEVDASLERDFSTSARLTVGAAGGGDWIRSSALGDHQYAKDSVFSELQWSPTSRLSVESALRLDHYSTFGSAWSPSAGAAWRLAPRVRLRTSVGHAFRIPTFTELYYSDPANVGNPNLRPERGWSLDGGIEWTPGAWTISLSPFARWDSDVIDWVRATDADLWQATNVRNVTTTGVETSAARRWHGALLRVYYAGMHVDAPSLTLESKYVLAYARHQSGGSIAAPLGASFHAALNVDHRHRADGQSYDLVSAKLSRAFSRLDVFVSGTNLLNETYQEVAGVDLPGRWVTVGVDLR